MPMDIRYFSKKDAIEVTAIEEAPDIKSNPK